MELTELYIHILYLTDGFHENLQLEHNSDAQIAYYRRTNNCW